MIPMITLLPMLSAKAMEFTAPTVPQAGQSYMPQNTESFGEGLWTIIKLAVSQLHPAVAAASGICLTVIISVLILSILELFPGYNITLFRLLGAVIIGITFLSPAHTLICLGTRTVQQLHEYGKLFLPVMTAALAAQGGVSTSTVMYAATAGLCSFLTGFICKIIVPLLYIFLCLCIASHALEDPMLKRLRNFSQWIMVWSLKMLLYCFTGYLTITGVVSGTADAAALKATKLAISGAVPVVGSILSDASETILVSAGIMKNAAGIYGLLAMIALWIGPFMQIGCQYLLTKITGAICSVFGASDTGKLVEEMAGAMGVVLAMTGTSCLLLMVSTVCFMKGMG